MTTLKPKLWWLFFTPRLLWVTWYPVIYYPATVIHYPSTERSFNPALVAHESVHILQQQSGKWMWLLKYVLLRNFRLAQEVEAIKAELQHYPAWKQEAVRLDYAGWLSSSMYLWAASSKQSALNSLLGR